MTHTEMVASLQAMGFIVGPRDPRRNTDFQGCYMVAQPCDDAELPMPDAERGGWCVVGDDLPGLVEETYAAFDC